MPRARLALTVALLAVPFVGCLGQTPEGPDLAALGAEVTVHTDEGACRVPTTVAEESGLLEAASDAIAHIHNTHRRAFVPGQVEAILDESHYVQVHFPPNTTIDLPSYPAANATQFEDLYLIWHTPAGVDSVLSNGGEYGTTYPVRRLEAPARTAVDASCPDGPNAGDPDGAYRMAWVHGDEQVDPPPPGVCDVRFDHRVLPAERSIEYLGSIYDFDPANVSRMTAFDVWEHPADCPVAYRLNPNAVNVSAELGGYGTLDLVFEDNHTLNVDDERWLAPGQNVSLSYNTSTREEGYRQWRNGTITVAYMEGWPRSGLQAEDG